MRQYIGARYTIKVYQNTITPSSAEWQANTHYEPITLVTYNNSSYLSKKDVPPTVGNPAANPSYWVVTGYYNGQIATLQSEIDDINNNKLPLLQFALDHYFNRKIVWIGDSYMESNYGTLTPADSFARKVGARLGLTENVDYFVSALSGYGFSKPSHQFITLLNNISISIPDDEVTDVIVCGGANDESYINDIYDDITAFCVASRTRFPNAIIHLGFTDWFMGSGNKYGTMIKEWKRAACANGVCFMENIWMNQHSWSLKLSDGHPNINGQEMIAAGIVNYLLTGTVSTPQLGNVPVTLIAETDVTIVGGVLYSNIEGTECSITFDWTQFTFTNPIAATVSSPTFIAVASFVTGTVGGSEYSGVTYPISLIVYDENFTAYSCPGVLQIVKGLLKIAPMVTQNMNVKRIYLPSTTIKNGYMNI